MDDIALIEKQWEESVGREQTKEAGALDYVTDVLNGLREFIEEREAFDEAQHSEENCSLCKGSGVLPVALYGKQHNCTMCHGNGKELKAVNPAK